MNADRLVIVGLGELTMFAVTRPQHSLSVPPTQWLRQGHGMTLKVDHTLFQFQVIHQFQ